MPNISTVAQEVLGGGGSDTGGVTGGDPKGLVSLGMESLTLLIVIMPYLKSILERLRKTEDRVSQHSRRIGTIEK